MSYDQFNNPRGVAGAYAGTAVDAGLQAHMRRVYNTMGLGLVVTGLTAFAVSSTPALMQLFFGNQITAIIVAFLPLAFIFLGFTPGRVQRWDAGRLQMLFYVFAAVMGLSMAAIFSIYTAESIARVFFITAAMFAATSIYGYTTKRDLASMGAFMFMGVIGLLIASIVNLFLQSSMLTFVTSVIGVIVFTGMTAWETQRIKETYAYASAMAGANAKLAVMGALSLYMNFVMLFQYLIQLLGQRE